MRVRPEALAAWDLSDEHARREILEHALSRARRSHATELGAGMTSALHEPVLEIVAAREAPHLLLATIASSRWSYHSAQAGSDWSVQTVDIVEIASLDGVVNERVLHDDTIELDEASTEHHDFDRRMRDVIDGWLRGGAVAIARAREAAEQRADVDTRRKRDGWPSEVRRVPEVEVIRASTRRGRTIVATCATVWIHFRARTGEDWTSQFVTIAETTIEGERFEVHPLVETERQYTHREPHDDAGFTRVVIERWLVTQPPDRGSVNSP